ncbi:MAG: IS1634 family transposase [Clostridiales Family XIII bacterium]|jgi:transposase|nr:IS1634 family transposase [Clostridiales Family XIII bacterium]
MKSDSNTTPSPTEAKPPKLREQVIKGTRYTYLDYPYWDPYKKQMRHKRVYTGHYDESGNFIDSKHYVASLQKPVENNNIIYKHKFFGATYLLDKISNNIGLFDDLKYVFPNEYKKIISLVYYLVLENDNNFYKYNKWEKFHITPYGKPIDSQRISELLSNISENQKINFFKLQIDRRLSEEYLVYDITSISSYSELIKHIKYGHSKDNDDLPRVNLALILGQNSFMPVYYRLLPGNINDVTTIQKFIYDTKFLGISNMDFIMDRGFYSADNINNMALNNLNYIVGIRNSAKIVSNYVKNFSGDFDNHNCFLNDYGVFYHTKNIYTPFNTRSKYNNNIKTNKSYLHIYHDPHKAIEDKNKFYNKVNAIKNRLKDKIATKSDINFLKNVTSLSFDGKRFNIQIDDDLIKEYTYQFGFFSLISNYIDDANTALSIYKNKDIIEKSFANLKNRLNFRRTCAHSYDNLGGALFVQFIALILLFYINNVMKKNNLYNNYTLETLLDEFDIIERFEYKSSVYHYGEITNKQADLFNFFGINIREIIP